MKTSLPISIDLYIQLFTGHLHLDISVTSQVQNVQYPNPILPLSQNSSSEILGVLEDGTIIHWFIRFRPRNPVVLLPLFCTLPSQIVHKAIMTYVSLKVFQIAPLSL